MMKAHAQCLYGIGSVLRLLLGLDPALWWPLVLGQNMDINPCIL